MAAKTAEMMAVERDVMKAVKWAVCSAAKKAVKRAA